MCNYCHGRLLFRVGVLAESSSSLSVFSFDGRYFSLNVTILMNTMISSSVKLGGEEFYTQSSSYFREPLSLTCTLFVRSGTIFNIHTVANPIRRRHLRKYLHQCHLPTLILQAIECFASVKTCLFKN